MAVHDGSLWMLVFVFSPEFVWNSPEEYAYLSPFFERGARFSNRIARDFAEYGVMSGCLEKISEEYEKKSPGWELMVKANLLMFLAYANRYYMQKGALRREKGNFRYSRIREAVAYIHAHFDKELTLEELAAQAAMGKSYFSSYFTEVMKMRVFDYIERVRVNHGAMLLKSTEDSVLEVALQSGFHSSSYFNRVFKKIWKTTPSAYRKSKDSTKNQE